MTTCPLVKKIILFYFKKSVVSHYIKNSSWKSTIQKEINRRILQGVVYKNISIR